MKKLILFTILSVAVSANAQVTKLLLYCDHYTPQNASDIYIDVFVDFDATANTFSNIEAGIVKSETDKYPDYLWSLSIDYTTDASTAVVNIEKDLDALALNFPVVATKDAVPTFAIPTANGKVTDFNVDVKGTLNGVSVAESFLCYDPTTKEQPAQ